ncbi:hypothetical protein PInf_018598 [Phytophthora infestans]|nr:hypothetical protein PInf_018598 [Phytophthora infestans]
MVELDVDGALFDSAAVWSAFWSVDAETHGRAIERADRGERDMALMVRITDLQHGGVVRVYSWWRLERGGAVGCVASAGYLVAVSRPGPGRGAAHDGRSERNGFDAGDVAAFTARLHLASIAELPAQIVIVAATETDAIKE